LVRSVVASEPSNYERSIAKGFRHEQAAQQHASIIGA
jgi:hypothetical protein